MLCISRLPPQPPANRKPYTTLAGSTLCSRPDCTGSPSRSAPKSGRCRRSPVAGRLFGRGLPVQRTLGEPRAPSGVTPVPEERCEVAALTFASPQRSVDPIQIAEQLIKDLELLRDAPSSYYAPTCRLSMSLPSEFPSVMLDLKMKNGRSRHQDKKQTALVSDQAIENFRSCARHPPLSPTVKVYTESSEMAVLRSSSAWLRKVKTQSSSARD